MVDGHNLRAPAALSEHQCQREFQPGVTYTTTAISGEISAKEKLMCPLLWCRTSVEDLPPTLRHGSSCSVLSDTYYWCPYCTRPEQFKDCASKSPRSALQNEPKKETVYGRAMAFFKEFRHGGDGYLNSSSPCRPDTSTGDPSAYTYCPDHEWELHGTSKPAESDRSNVYENNGKAPYSMSESGSSPPTNYVPANITSHLRQSDYPAGSPIYTSQTVGSGYSVVATGMESGNRPSSNRAINPEDQTVASHKSDIGATLCVNEIFAPSTKLPHANTPASQTPNAIYARASLDAYQFPIERTQGTNVPPRVTFKGVEPLRNGGRSTSHAYIADFCDVIRAISEEWTRRVPLSISDPHLDPELYVRALFELGIRALSKYFQGGTPNNFQDIFALAHVAIASSYMVYKDEDGHSWNTALEDACQWQDLLSDVLEKETFVKVMSRLCHPQRSTNSSSFEVLAIDDDFLPAEKATLARLVCRLSSTGVHVGSHQECDKSRQDPLTGNGQTRLLGLLRSNVLIKGCMDLLDGKSLCHMVLELTDPLYLSRFSPRCPC